MGSQEGAKPAATDGILGRTVGNYRVEKRLGGGGMGAVYLLRHARLPNTLAALKVMKNSEAGGATMKERFEQEALVAAAVGSHRVVRPLDLGEFDDGVPYIVMEYVAGRTLAEELDRCETLPLVTALKIAYRIADTMATAHEKGIVHRDLKPSNLMLAREGRKDFVVKVLDFGVARASGEYKVANTVHNMIVGTPGYMSPEAATAAPLDGRADVFSLGVVLFQMLAGELPFAAPSVQKAVTNVITLPAPTVASRRPPHLDAVPPEVEELVARALAKEPAGRFTMSELHAALASALQTLTASGTGEPQTLMSIALPAERRSTPAPSSDELSEAQGEAGASGRAAKQGNEKPAPSPAGQGAPKGPESVALEAALVSALKDLAASGEEAPPLVLALAPTDPGSPLPAPRAAVPRRRWIWLAIAAVSLGIVIGWRILGSRRVAATPVGALVPAPPRPVSPPPAETRPPLAVPPSPPVTEMPAPSPAPSAGLKAHPPLAEHPRRKASDVKKDKRDPESPPPVTPAEAAPPAAPPPVAEPIKALPPPTGFKQPKW